MKALLLVLLLSACTTVQRPLTEICAIRVVKVIDEQTLVAIEHCEPEGTPI